MSMKGGRTVGRTFSGMEINYAKPDPGEIRLLDIAHHLAFTARYNGACEQLFSVAQHSLLVASILPREYKAAGLLHDAAEAWLGDVVRPLKNVLPDYRHIEARFQRAVEKAFGLAAGVLQDPLVIEADRRVMALEMHSSLLGWDDLLEYPLAAAEIRLEAPLEVRAGFIAAARAALTPQAPGRLREAARPDERYFSLFGPALSLRAASKWEAAERVDAYVFDEADYVADKYPVHMPAKDLLLLFKAQNCAHLIMHENPCLTRADLTPQDSGHMPQP